jgi:hypothetical protein
MQGMGSPTCKLIIIGLCSIELNDQVFISYCWKDLSKTLSLRPYKIYFKLTNNKKICIIFIKKGIF